MAAMVLTNELQAVTRRAMRDSLKRHFRCHFEANPLLSLLLRNADLRRERDLLWSQPNRAMRRERRRQYLVHRALEGL